VDASSHTIAGYRDTFRLLLGYASNVLGRPPTKLQVEDIGADLVPDFWDGSQCRSARRAHTRRKAHLDDQFTYSREVDGGSAGLRVLASSCPQNRTYYAAVQEMTDGRGGEVFAIICKVSWNPNSRSGEQFGYKDMTESMGPCEDNCPQHIPDLLSLTDKEHAID
jgi:hypothetical protein